MDVLRRLFGQKETTPAVTLEPRVTPDASRCVQCGICSYNCPVGIDVRAYAFRGVPVEDLSCIACGTCVDRCPRNTLRFAMPREEFLAPKDETIGFELPENTSPEAAPARVGA